MHRTDLMSLNDKKIIEQSIVSHEMISCCDNINEYIENSMADSLAEYIIKHNKIDLDTEINDPYYGVKHKRG